MPKYIFHYFLLGCYFTLTSQLNVSGQSADIILTNGKIFTSDNSNLYVQALAIKGNKILATGTNVTIEKLASAKTKKIDLKGKTVVPGINDQHDHEPGGVDVIPLKYDYHDFDNWDGLSKRAVLDSIAKLLLQAKQGEWVGGFIGNTILGDTSMRRSLDSIAPNNPVLLSVFWGAWHCYQSKRPGGSRAK